MTNRFMISVAAVALLAGTGFANAQGAAGREAPSAGSTAQPSAPSSDRAGTSAAPMNRDSASDSKSSDKGMKSTQSDEKMQPPGARNQRAQDDMKAGTKGEKSVQDNMKGEKSKSMSSETKDNATGGKDMKAEDRSDSKMNNAQSKEGRPGANPTADSQGNRSQTTTGNAATSATAAPPAEKRTQIVSAIKSEKVEEVTTVNFNISVGAVVPTSVRFYPLPPRIVEIYPEWRGYVFILVHGRYVILRPQTHEIVYIIEG